MYPPGIHCPLHLSLPAISLQLRMIIASASDPGSTCYLAALALVLALPSPPPLGICDSTPIAEPYAAMLSTR